MAKSSNISWKLFQKGKMATMLGDVFPYNWDRPFYKMRQRQSELYLSQSYNKIMIKSIFVSIQ